MIELIAFDADDTLWHNETLYTEAQEKFKALLSKYHSREWIEQKLYETETRNLEHFGYGIKAFMLSMIETAVDLTEGRITGSEVGQIVEFGKAMIGAEIRLFEGVQEALARLSQAYPLMMITKGDLLDQEGKLARSGLRDYFKYVEITPDKTPQRYQAILARLGVVPAHFIMIGNALKSDILPVLETGGRAVYIPYALTWAHENEDEPAPGTWGYYRLEKIGDLPGLIEKIENGE